MKTEQAEKVYTQAEVDKIVSERVRKAIRQDRELLCQVIRGMPDLDATTKQGWIENPNAMPGVLSQCFSPDQRIIVVDDHTIRVNLDAPPMLPFDGAKVETNKGGGWVTVQKRADGLYVDGRKVILHLSERQKGGKVIRGYELRDEVTNLPVLHPNIMDALYEHSHLIPEEWKHDENSNTIFIYFWAVTYCDRDGYVCVRCLSWGGGRWHRSYDWLSYGFYGDYPAAVLASLPAAA